MDVYAKHNIKIVDEGNGPTILLVHGFGCDQNLWRPVVDRLKSAFRLVLIDLVGSGLSDPEAWDPTKYSSLSGYAADILDVVDELHLRDVVFVGHSVSAMIGALATTHRSEQVRQARDADSLPVLHRRRRLSRRLLQGRYRRTAGIPRPELPWLVPCDGAGHHGDTGPTRSGGRVGRHLLQNRPRAAPGCSPAPHSSRTTAPICPGYPCPRW